MVPVTSRRFVTNRPRGNCSRSLGFSLLELMVTLAMFLVISGAAFTLVTRHMPLFASQQDQSTLNFGLRNAAAQIQIDGVNAGTGFYSAANMPGWPIGVTFKPGPGDDCHSPGTQTYGDGCFDRLNVLKIDINTPPAIVVDSNGNNVPDESHSNGNDVSASSILHVAPADPTRVSLDSLAGAFQENDQILVVSQDGQQMATATLSKGGQTAGNKVNLQHNPTAADGTVSSDIYLIATHPNNKLATKFLPGDWVLKLAPAVFRVDASNPNNPKLARLQPGNPKCDPRTAVEPYDQSCIIAEQIIGFKVGAQLFGQAQDCEGLYCYKPENIKDDASSLGYDWTMIRAIRVTLIGRTTPNAGPQSKKNGFDQGPYKIESVSLMITPRSLTALNGQQTEKTYGAKLGN